MPELTIDQEMTDSGVCILRLEGFLDAHTFEELDEQVGELFDAGTFKIVADLGGVEYISSAGAGVFIGSLAIAQEGGGDIIIINPLPNVQEVFDLLGLSQIFRIMGSEDEAIAAMG